MTPLVLVGTTDSALVVLIAGECRGQAVACGIPNLVAVDYHDSSELGM